jgi:hypothetical protein
MKADEKFVVKSISPRASARADGGPGFTCT